MWIEIISDLSYQLHQSGRPKHKVCNQYKGLAIFSPYDYSQPSSMQISFSYQTTRLHCHRKLRCTGHSQCICPHGQMLLPSHHVLGFHNARLWLQPKSLLCALARLLDASVNPHLRPQFTPPCVYCVGQLAFKSMVQIEYV